MFSLMRRKQSKPTQGNPQARLTKRQKQKLAIEKQQLESDIKSIDRKLDGLKIEFDLTQQSLNYAPQDLKKIEYAIDKEWYTTCSEICHSHNWENAAFSFDEAERLEKAHKFDRRHHDAAAAGVVRIERQLRDDQKKVPQISKSMKILTNKRQVLEQKLKHLKQ